MAEQYTLTQADVDGCRQILARLAELDEKTGGYYVDSVQGHGKSATATVHYALTAGPLVTAEAVAHALDSVSNLGQLCKKVIAHAETHPEHVRDERVLCAQCQLTLLVDRPVGDPECPHTEEWWASRG